MTIIVFLVDTSASMNQTAYLLGGKPTLLDLAKRAVETFVKIRQKSPESRGDRYMLLTFEEPPFNIKAGWKENLGTFQTELKNLEATCVTQLGASLKNTFDMLNVNRMQTGIDMYGQGRFPYFLEPTMIITITDGGRLYNSKQGVQDELKSLPGSTIPGYELTKEAFRWDQRLFSLVLRLAGTPPVERGDSMVPSDSSAIDNICELTGGRSYAVTSYRTMFQCIDSLVQKVQNGVVIYFEKSGPDPPPTSASEGNSDTDSENKTYNKENTQNSANDVSDGGGSKALVNGGGSSRPQTPTTVLNPCNTTWYKCRKLIYVQKSAQKGFAVGFWPIPEAFWPDPNAPTLPTRSAHPEVKFTCTGQEPMVIESLPFDKYELEPSPLTQYILSRRQPSVCWQVFVANSYKNSDTSHPFGYLKASTNLHGVNLFVMPYNYPVLLPLLEELFKVHRLKPTKEWKLQFENYLRNMPAYYATPLRRALQRMSAPPGLVPDTLDNNLSVSVINYLRRLKNQAKQEYDKLCSDVGKRTKPVAPAGAAEGIRVIPRTPLLKEVTSHPCLEAKFQYLKDQLSDFSGFIVCTKGESSNPRQRYMNPFHIPPHCILEQLTRMRANFMKPSFRQTRMLDEDELHSLPVGQMGNYQDYLKRMPPPLREIESAPVRQHMFGNPFKIDKRMMVDEADIDMLGGGGSGGGSGSGSGRTSGKRQNDGAVSGGKPQKRKPGPLPKDFKFRRMSTDTIADVTLPVIEAMDSSFPAVVDLSDSDSAVETVTLADDSEEESPPTLPPVFSLPDTLNDTPNDYLFNHINETPQYNHFPTRVKNNNKINNHHQAKQHNKKLKLCVNKEIRRPGKDYSKLLDLLKEVEGPSEIRVPFLELLVQEALRFKRRKMAAEIERFILLSKNGMNNGPNR